MPSFTVQRSEKTGELYVLEYDGTDVVGWYGPVSARYLETLTPETLHLIDFDDEAMDERWGIPLEYRDGEWLGRDT